MCGRSWGKVVFKVKCLGCFLVVVINVRILEGRVYLVEESILVEWGKGELSVVIVVYCVS